MWDQNYSLINSCTIMNIQDMLSIVPLYHTSIAVVEFGATLLACNTACCGPNALSRPLLGFRCITP